MQKRHLTLLVPDLSQILAATEQYNLPNLRLLLGRSKALPVTSQWERLLFGLFNLPNEGELPIAAVTGLLDKLPTQQGYWLRADPVQLQADLAAIYFLGNEHLRLDAAEIEKIHTQLDQLLQQDNLVLYTPHAQRWYIALKNDPQIRSYFPSDILGKDISHFLPSGAGQQYWRKLLTEIQMLLHVNPGNINGVWFWGVGHLPAKPIIKWRKVWSDEVFTRALMQLAGGVSAPVPTDLSECLAAMPESGDYLVTLTLNPQQSLQNLETHWFTPLITALRSRQLTSVDLYIGANQMYHITCWTIYYIWKSLARKNII